MSACFASSVVASFLLPPSPHLRHGLPPCGCGPDVLLDPLGRGLPRPPRSCLPHPGRRNMGSASSERRRCRVLSTLDTVCEPCPSPQHFFLLLLRRANGGGRNLCTHRILATVAVGRREYLVQGRRCICPRCCGYDDGAECPELRLDVVLAARDCCSTEHRHLLHHVGEAERNP